MVWKGGKGGAKKIKEHFPEASAWGVFVRRFCRRFRPARSNILRIGMKGRGRGNKIKEHFPETSAWGDFVRRFHRRFQPEELYFKNRYPCAVYCEGPPSFIWWGRGRGFGQTNCGTLSRGFGLRSFRPEIPSEISAWGVFVGRRFTVKVHLALFEGRGWEGGGERGKIINYWSIIALRNKLMNLNILGIGKSITRKVVERFTDRHLANENNSGVAYKRKLK